MQTVCSIRITGYETRGCVSCEKHFHLICSSQSLFGETTPIVALSTKKSVQFFMKFLADLVPYEPAEYLKVSVYVSTI